MEVRQCWAAERAQAEKTLARLALLLRGGGGGGHDVSDQPRDEDGKWTDGGGGDGGSDGAHPGEGYSKEAYVKDGVIHTPNVYDAQRALFENRKVELKQPKQVSTLIKLLGKTAAKMEEHGETAPVFNLCNVSISGTNLFCAETKGIPRVEMPVIPAKQTKAFIKYLKSEGYKVEKEKEFAANLRATQSEISGVKVAAAMKRIKKEGFYKRLVISRDDYILDGHHTWAGQLGVDAQDNNLRDDKSVKVARVDISITKLIAEAEKWTGGAGKKPASESAKSGGGHDVSDEPRDESGKWTDGGGGDGGTGGSAPAAEPALDPNVIAVGGDEWNKATAVRLEREYQAARPEVDKIAQEAPGKTTPDAPDDDEEDAPFIAEEWDQLSNTDQEAAGEAYVEKSESGYYDGEVENWQSEYAPDDAKALVASKFNSGDDDAWARDAITEYREQREDAGESAIPFDDEQLIRAIAVDYAEGQGGSWPKTGVAVTFDDDKLQAPEGYDPNQETLPGIEPIEPHELLTADMREGVTTALTKAFEKKSDDVAGDLEPPDYLHDNAKEFAEESWAQWDDSSKFEWTKNNTDIIEGASDASGDEIAASEMTVDKLPSKFDPLNETSGQDYRRTQALARHLSVARTKQLLEARNIAAPSDTTIAGVDKKLWSAWKGSSTSEDGQLLQVATADELGGRLNLKTAVTIDRDDSISYANHKYESIGGYPGVKAYVRAKWETTQYLLDKAGIQDLNLYRGIRFDQEKIDKDFALKAMQSAQKIEGHTYLPALEVDRNGAASTSISANISNGWGNGGNRIVLRAHVPRTAAISVPAFGINVHSEREVVVAGTAWKGWDAWKEKAPGFEDVPLKHAA
jgi:hypothetical protein